MNNTHLITMMAIFCMLVISAFYGRRKVTEIPYPRVAHPLDCYDADFIDLAYKIEHAQTIRQLHYYTESIKAFKTRYIAYKEPIQLQIDVNKLRKRYKEQRVTVEIRTQLLN